MPSDDEDATLYQFTPPPPPPPSDQAHPGGGRRKRRSRVTKAAAGLALVLGTGGGAAAVVLATSPGQTSSLASTSATTSPTKVPPGDKTGRGFAWRMRGGPFAGGMGAAGGPAMGGPFGGPMGGPTKAGPFGFIGGGGIVHASYTIKGPNGSYETLDTQVGTVDDVSSSSITVKSADGYSQQYAVDSSTVVYADYNGIGSVKTGDNVEVVGLVGSSGVTAERVVDITQVQANGQSWEPTPTAPPTTATPSGSTSGDFTGDDPGSAA